MNISILKKLLESISMAAEHPLSTILFVLVLICWLISFLLKKPQDVLDKFNKKDRWKLLKFSKLHQQYFKLARLGISLFTLITILGMAGYYYLELSNSTKILKVSGLLTLDDKPLDNAKISIIGIDRQWNANSSGIFNFEIIDTFKSDSITFVITYSTKTNREVLYDTTLNKNSLNQLQIRRVNPGTCIVSGIVIDSITNKPISGATVKIIGEENFAITSESGEFEFEINFSEGQAVRMRVWKKNHVGYDNYIRLPGPITILFR